MINKVSLRGFTPTLVIQVIQQMRIINEVNIYKMQASIYAIKEKNNIDIPTKNYRFGQVTSVENL